MPFYTVSPSDLRGEPRELRALSKVPLLGRHRVAAGFGSSSPEPRETRERRPASALRGAPGAGNSRVPSRAVPAAQIRRKRAGYSSC